MTFVFLFRGNQSHPAHEQVDASLEIVRVYQWRSQLMSQGGAHSSSSSFFLLPLLPLPFSSFFFLKNGEGLKGDLPIGLQLHLI